MKKSKMLEMEEAIGFLKERVDDAYNYIYALARHLDVGFRNQPQISATKNNCDYLHNSQTENRVVKK